MYVVGQAGDIHRVGGACVDNLHRERHCGPGGGNAGGVGGLGNAYGGGDIREVNVRVVRIALGIALII